MFMASAGIAISEMREGNVDSHMDYGSLMQISWP